DEKKVTEEPGKKGGDPSKEGEKDDQEEDVDVNSTNSVYTVSLPINIVGSSFVNVDGSTFVNAVDLLDDLNMPALEDDSIFGYNNLIFDFSNDDEDGGAMADMKNLDTTIQVSFIPTTRIHKDHPLKQVIGDFQSSTLTRKMPRNLEEYGFVSTTLKQRTNHKDLQNYLFACFYHKKNSKR
ncbi:hypothetical protein Tco_0225173, partial [Tanacetum coccineum]